MIRGFFREDHLINLNLRLYQTSRSQPRYQEQEQEQEQEKEQARVHILCSLLLVLFSLGLTLIAVIVMGHFQTGPSESTFYVEPFVCFAAIEDSLIAADLLRDEVERLD